MWIFDDGDTLDEIRRNADRNIVRSSSRKGLGRINGTTMSVHAPSSLIEALAAATGSELTVFKEAAGTIEDMQVVRYAGHVPGAFAEDALREFVVHLDGDERRIEMAGGFVVRAAKYASCDHCGSVAAAQFERGTPQWEVAFLAEQSAHDAWILARLAAHVER